MIDCMQFREYIVRPALQDINMSGSKREELLIATCAQESQGGTYIKQLDGGPALGPYQMEGKTYNDLFSGFLSAHVSLAGNIFKSNYLSQRPAPEAMIYNWRLATQMAAVFYMQRTAYMRLDSEPLPDDHDLDQIWNYYKQHWNTKLGATTKDQFVKNYFKFTGKKKGD